VQMHMSMSGMDYFGSDIGGFHRGALDGNLNDLYTQWFANGMAFDIPGRVHTENLCNCKETTPDRIGDLKSNLENVRLRYEMSPYMYSLSHRAYLYAEPVIPPLVYYYQSDPEVREMGHEKLIGRDLLAAIVAAYGEIERQVYLPAGSWYNYYTNEVFHSKGEWFGPFPTSIHDQFKLPLFARAGAIIPQMFVDDKTMNITGQRSDGSLRDELILRVYPSPSSSSFTLFEDDGTTTGYQNGEVRTTLLSQNQTGQSVTVTIGAALGNYTDAPVSRDNVVKLILEQADLVSQVQLNGAILMEYPNQPSWEAAASGWYSAGQDLIVAKSGSMLVTEEIVFDFK
jgi:alpha-glucosidase (family GH31 glycosyl hydrolase)